MTRQRQHSDNTTSARQGQNGVHTNQTLLSLQITGPHSRSFNSVFRAAASHGAILFEEDPAPRPERSHHFNMIFCVFACEAVDRHHRDAQSSLASRGRRVHFYIECNYQ